MAIGTATVTETVHTSVKKIKWVWASSADNQGALKVTTKAYDGLIERAEFIPDSGGTTPSNLYDVTITDSESVDVLAALGADLSNAATVTKVHSNGLGAVAGSVLTLNVSNAGLSKGGTVILYLR